MVWLTQTDTTVGFLSQDAEALVRVKQRDLKKPFLTALPDLKSLKKRVRVPKFLHKEIRRANKRTYILNNIAYRVVQSGEHHHFLKRIGWAYSTSANRSSEEYNEKFCFENADILHFTKDGFSENEPSSLFKVIRNKSQRLR